MSTLALTNRIINQHGAKIVRYDIFTVIP